MNTSSVIEPLESRIAPAGVTIALNKMSATYIDVDGDVVTIKYTQPVADQVVYKFDLPADPNQLTGMDLTAITVAGVGVSITAKQRITGGMPVGDGLANVGFFNALGIDLGAVSIAGDVAKIL